MPRILFLALLLTGLALRAEEANLLTEPLKITNPKTTVFKDGIYTFDCPDNKSRSELVQTVTLDQKTAGPITFAIEGCGIENESDDRSYFGVYLDLVFADGSRLNSVNFGIGNGVFPWRTRSRIFRPAKPIRTVTYRVCYNFLKGKIAVRHPQLYNAAVSFAAPGAPGNPFGKHRIGIADRHTYTPLVRDGKAITALVGDPALCTKINAAVKEKTGVELPVLPHTAYENAEKLDRPLIVIGSRDNNRTSSNLYLRHYSLIDAKYPGPGGSDLHSVHDPLGDGHNVIIAGGSDAAGDALAVKKLCKHIRQCPAGASLRLGFISDATLSPSYKVARDVKDIPLWESSVAAGWIDGYGWNSLSRNLAMLYITNDPYYKNEFMRLAFPRDKATCDELFKRDGEAYRSNFSEPIVEVYHYYSAQMALYWDLVNANPLFSDAERQKVDERFYRQLATRAAKVLSDYRGKERLVRPDRHHAWEALTIYTTARYLDKTHPCFDTKEGLRIGRNAMEPLFRTPTVGNIAFFWLPTSVELQVYYASLQGHRLVGSPALRAYANLLTLTNTLGFGTDDRTGKSTANWVFAAAAALAQDQGLYTIFLTKTKPGNFADLHADYSVFRLGQSFWAAKPYAYDSLADHAGKWNSFAGHLPEKPEKTELLFTSYRSTPDASGDYLLIDPHYSTGLRDPQHNFAMIYAYLDGMPLLHGYENALVPYVNGLTFGKYPFDAKILSQGTAGEFVWITGRVENFNGFDWERTWLLRKGRSLTAIDRVTARRSAMNARFDVTFAAGFRGSLTALPNGDLAMKNRYNGRDGEFLWSFADDCPVSREPGRWGAYLPGDRVTFRPAGPMKTGDTRTFVTLLRPGKPANTRSTARQEDTFALAAPAPALLKLTQNGFTLTDAEQTFSLTDGKAALASGDAAKAAEAAKMLADRPRLAYTPPALPEKIADPAWRATVPGPVGQAIPAGDGILAASGKTVRLFSKDGKERFAATFGKDVASLAYFPEKQLFLVGTFEEKLVALDAGGKVKWTFTSQMDPQVLHYGPYWHKRSVPGVRSLLVKDGLIYAGSASTVEILDAEGKLQARKFVLYGGVDAMMLNPANGKLLLFRPGGGAALHEIDGKFQVVMQPLWSRGLRDDLSGYGFNQVGQQQAAFFRDAAGNWRAANILTGAQNRLVIREPSGKPLYEADFGPGVRGGGVTIPNDGARTLRNLRLADLDGDGVPEICVTHANGSCYIFDDRAEVKALYDLHALPLSLASDGKVFYAGMADGRIIKIDKTGPCVVGKMKGRIFVLEVLPDGGLFAGTSAGEAAVFKQ